jgi:hypothetical protein
MKFSIYSTAYNLKAGLFDLDKSIKRFCDFAEEVVIATNTQEDYKILSSYQSKYPNLKVVCENIPLSDYAFDGKLKNIALQMCTGDFGILLDLDEYIPIDQKPVWQNIAHKWVSSIADPFSKPAALLIPVIDLIQDVNHYKSIGFKWYLHTLAGCHRGVVNFAKLDNGKIDIAKSDTTELLDYKGDLIPSSYLFDPNLSESALLSAMKFYNIFVVHEGWLHKEQRAKQSAFWKPHWENRGGQELQVTDLNALYSEEYPFHNLHI